MELIFISVLLIALMGLFSVIGLAVDFKAFKTKYFERNTDDLLNKAYKKKYTNRLIRYVESEITKSNIKFYIPFYNVFWHIFVSVIMLFIFYTSHFIIDELFINLSFGAIGFSVPFIGLNVMGYAMESKVRKQSIVYMTAVRNYNRTFNDLFKSFEMVIESSPEPLKSYTKSMVMKHKAKISQAKCLNDFQTNVGPLTEIGLLVDNLKLALYEGADINKLIEEYIIDMEKLYEIEDSFRADEISSDIMIYILVLIVIGGTKMVYAMDYTQNIVNLWWHQITVVVALFVSLFIIVKTLRR